MKPVSLLAVAAALVAVLWVASMLLRVLNRYVRSMESRRTQLRVAARIGLGPRQGLAVVCIGERAVLVSVGDGGVHTVLELQPEERMLFDAPAASERARPPGQLMASLRGRWPGGLRRIAVLGALLLAGFAGPLRATTVRTPVSEGAGAPVATVTVGKAATPIGAAPGRAAGGPAATQAAQAGTTAAQTTRSTGATAAALDSLGSTLPRVDLKVGGGAGSGLHLSGTVGMVVLIGLLAVLPTLLLLMTSFTRIIIVLHFLRSALGTQTAPPSQLLAALALLLTGFVMAPTLATVNRTALQPWMQGRIDEGQMIAAAMVPMRQFMLRQTRERDIDTFVEMTHSPPPASVQDVPTVVLVSAFTTSELRAAFEMGFALFLPFVVIDLVVAAVLTSMGMFMLPPTMIALPCKLMLFVLVDGWTLVVHSLVTSFH